MEFQKFPKIFRIDQAVVVTEKIDGTNGALVINDDGELAGIQSRKRMITTADDNHGFAAWAVANRTLLEQDLGPGYHYGEWWGSGIQRRYGLDEKRFSLFNTHRWYGTDFKTPGLTTVPVLYQGPYDERELEKAYDALQDHGSFAAPGFDRPEGFVVFFTQSRFALKYPFGK